MSIATITFGENVLALEDLNRYAPKSTFEHDTLRFLKEWCSGASTFKMKTSGSTGKPSDIILTRHQMEASAKASIKAFGLKSGDPIHLCLNTNFIAGKMMLVRAVTGQMNIIAEEPKNIPERIDDTIRFTALVPLQLEGLLKNGTTITTLNKLKAIIVGGAPVNELLVEKLQSLICPVYATFGMTETATHIALCKLNGSDKSEFYRTLEGVEIGMDQRKCLTISAPMTNYKTIVTNDKVRIVNNREFEWLGRWDNIINSGGIKIQVEQVEKIVAHYFKREKINQRFFVGPMKDNKLGQKMILCLEGSQASSLLNSSLLISLKSFLPAYHTPKEMFFIKKFAETPTGKIDRKKTLSIIS
ncbi:AMP-binding protein [Fulvivirga sp. M361]|uniref:AMP-binding protein n=1 Tax=Fulvivirga sp. M361 TaxID=2594266 RepID=UPI00117B0668|nr:AMP-binding protein [Fulvivirga sp. M361]TRX49482.1 AMP-binding protein [Fulvivirga sp. M361]